MTTKKAKEDARGSAARLERILTLVPYCVKHPGVSLDELAAVFGVTSAEILEDLNLIFLCGLPDYTPADLMDVTWEGGQVWIRMADYFSRPLRLTRSEAIPLYVRARALLDLLASREEGMEELAPLRSALAKLGAALLPQDGGVAGLAERIRVYQEEGEAAWLPVLRDAVRRYERLEIEYFTYTRDTITRRRIDPLLVFASLGHWYVSAYCHLAGDRRLFRLDRVKSVEATGETFEAPAPDEAGMPAPYVAAPEDTKVTIRVSPRIAAWLDPEFLQPESVRELKRGWREITFRTSAFPWIEKLLLRFGREAQVVAPRELTELVRESAQRILSLYGTGGSAPRVPPKGKAQARSKAKS